MRPAEIATLSAEHLWLVAAAVFIALQSSEASAFLATLVDKAPGQSHASR